MKESERAASTRADAWPLHHESNVWPLHMRIVHVPANRDSSMSMSMLRASVRAGQRLLISFSCTSMYSASDSSKEHVCSAYRTCARAAHRAARP
eukprot:357422-Prymnesium_polylepis.1